MPSPQQKTTTLVQILFRATHTYSKDSKKRCLVNWSKNRVPINSHQLILIQGWVPNISNQQLCIPYVVGLQLLSLDVGHTTQL